MTRLGLSSARGIISTALAKAEEAQLLPLVVVVLDAGGHLIAAERQDGAPNKCYEVAHAKAYGAISLGLGSRTLRAVAEQNPSFIMGATSAIGGALVAVPGGVLIRNAEGDIVGAVGVSGDKSSDNDEAAAIAGITAVGFQAQPD